MPGREIVRALSSGGGRRETVRTVLWCGGPHVPVLQGPISVPPLLPGMSGVSPPRGTPSPVLWHFLIEG